MKHSARHNRNYQSTERGSQGRFTGEQNPPRYRSSNDYFADVAEDVAQDENKRDTWDQYENEYNESPNYNRGNERYSEGRSFEDQDRFGNQYEGEGTGRGQGFTSWDRDEVREIGRRGRNSYGGQTPSRGYQNYGETQFEEERYGRGGRNQSEGRGENKYYNRGDERYADERNYGGRERNEYQGQGWDRDRGFSSRDINEDREAGSGRSSQGQSSSRGYQGYNVGNYENERYGRSGRQSVGNRASNQYNTGVSYDGGRDFSSYRDEDLEDVNRGLKRPSGRGRQSSSRSTSSRSRKGRGQTTSSNRRNDKMI